MDGLERVFAVYAFAFDCYGCAFDLDRLDRHRTHSFADRGVMHNCWCCSCTLVTDSVATCSARHRNCLNCVPTAGMEALAVAATLHIDPFDETLSVASLASLIRQTPRQTTVYGMPE